MSFFPSRIGARISRMASLSSLLLASGFTFGGGIAGVSVAHAQGASKASPGAPMPRMAYIDMQAAILKTEEGKTAKSRIEKEAEAKKTDLLNQQNELKKLDDEFQAQQAVLSEEAKAGKQKEFQSKLQNMRTAQMNFEQEVRQKEMQETQKIFQNLSGVIDEIAKKKNYDLVFERGSGALLYAAKIDDITEEVVSLYNSKHKVGKAVAK